MFAKISLLGEIIQPVNKGKLLDIKDGDFLHIIIKIYQTTRGIKRYSTYKVEACYPWYFIDDFIKLKKGDKIFVYADQFFDNENNIIHNQINFNSGCYFTKIVS